MSWLDSFEETLGLKDAPADAGFPADGSTVDSNAALSMSPVTGAESESVFSKTGNWLSSEFSQFESTVENDASAIASGAKNAVVSGYQTAKAGVSTVVGDIEAPIAGALQSVYLYAIVAIIVIGGVIYFAGKSGALRVSKVA